MRISYDVQGERLGAQYLMRRVLFDRRREESRWGAVPLGDRTPHVLPEILELSV
jgi:hypothetical protein